MAEKKFCDMDTEERFSDLTDRVSKFHLLQLPGQPQGMHMGTSYLIADLWCELQRVEDLKQVARNAVGVYFNGLAAPAVKDGIMEKLQNLVSKSGG